MIVKTERQVICRNTGLQCRKDENFLVEALILKMLPLRSPTYRLPSLIESDAGGNAHAFDEQFRPSRTDRRGRHCLRIGSKRINRQSMLNASPVAFMMSVTKGVTAPFGLIL